MFRRYVPVLVCVALAAGGCGGDDSDDPATGDAAPAQELTKAEYVARANSICSDTEDAQKAFDTRIDRLKRNDLRTAAHIIEDALKSTREGYDRLRALTPPASDKAQVKEYLASVQRLLQSRVRLTAALLDNDPAAARKVATQDDKLDAEQRRLAERLGLGDCNNTF